MLNEGWDVISFRNYWSSGSLCIFRNDEKMTRFYQRCLNWREIAALTTCGIVNFDEIDSQKFVLLERGERSVEDVCQLRDCMTAALWRANDIRMHCEDLAVEARPGFANPVRMSAGELTMNGRPLLYYHLIHTKGMRYFVCPRIPYHSIGDFVIDYAGYYQNLRPLRFSWRFVRGVLGAVLRKVGLKRIAPNYIQ